jgi:hypothetical protein
VLVCVTVGVWVGVSVGVLVAVIVGVFVGVSVVVAVGVAVDVLVGVCVGVRVGVGVWQVPSAAHVAPGTNMNEPQSFVTVQKVSQSLLRVSIVQGSGGGQPVQEQHPPTVA